MEMIETGRTADCADGRESLDARRARGSTDSNETLLERIADRIRRYVEPHAISSVCTAVLSGEVVHVDADVPPGAGIIALRRGILFVPHGEFRVRED